MHRVRYARVKLFFLQKTLNLNSLHIASIAFAVMWNAYSHVQLLVHFALYYLNLIDIFCLWQSPSYILFADASVNPENDLKYGAQNFGNNRNGHYVMPHVINNIINKISKKVKVNMSFVLNRSHYIGKRTTFASCHYKTLYGRRGFQPLHRKW